MKCNKIGACLAAFFLCSAFCLLLSSCTKTDMEISINTNKTYQTMEGFGASAAWWAQDVGGWTQNTENGNEIRAEILELLYDDNGIDLDIYRYNLGAGSKTDDISDYSDPWRKTESFIAPDGTVDYSRDANAVWCMQKAVNLGVENVVFFSNSAPDTMTINGKVHNDADESRLDYVDEEGNSIYYSKPNLDASQYQNFADYVLDAVEHFRAQGIPVTAVSPINEPQWAWQGGQEGCHYEPDEVVALYKVFLAEMQNRGLADTTELSMFESGQPFGDTLKRYLDPIMDDKDLSAAIKGLDTHSYWGTAEQKEKTAKYLNLHYRNLPVRCTEWTEMQGGKDVTMDSALVLANTMLEDLTILDAESWSYWIAVSAYDYRDGLIYVDRDAHTYETTKRLYVLGNFSKFVEPGAVRIGAAVGKNLPLSTVAFDCGDTVAVIVVNNTETEQAFTMDFNRQAKFVNVSAFLTDANHDLECVYTKPFAVNVSCTVPAQSVTTFVFQKEAAQ
ncbi:MAG: glycoside hydrolase [Candidatus Fimenecus sp.]